MDTEEQVREHYEEINYEGENDVEEALRDLHQAIESLDNANWRLEGLVAEDEDKVIRALRRDLRTVRTVLDQRHRGNASLSGYGYDHDRFMALRRFTPNTDLAPR
ncbi:hypothetical protein V9T20_12950 (plasmid) [Halobacterium salinarum]|jgi:ABC-type transporter Mla subunit MlaD|uniref:hypothetical protein n=1 Tax=Halobacterium salinarum TaxID=2242 RepID=UPI0030D5BEC9